VRVIDGTGAPGRDDQTVVIKDGKIESVVKAGPVPVGAEFVDLQGRTLIPGLVGMHDHLFYELDHDGSHTTYAVQSTFAKLYLASGVTTIRTAGAIDFRGDAGIKDRIDAGKDAGPKIYLTGPYLYGTAAEPDPDGIAGQVATYADRGATWFKAYTSLRTSELKAAVKAAHDRGLRVTGHLCAVGFRQAASLGIDNVEHGLLTDTEFYSGKQPDQCPEQSKVLGELLAMDIGGSDIRQTIVALVSHGVAVTSTLAIYESFAYDDHMIDPRVGPILASRLRDGFEKTVHARGEPDFADHRRGWAAVLRKEMQFERAFVRAGGKLLAGVDPTGWGGVLAGFGDQRNIELLVNAGFTPEQAIQIATSNGTRFLFDRNTGTIEPGMVADLVVVRGNPSRNISDIRNVESVFKNGVAYDPARLIAAAEGTLGGWSQTALFRWPYNVVLVVLISLLAIKIMWRLNHSTGMH
jgi:imidazolonepropionase-like amidohydrolase